MGAVQDAINLAFRDYVTEGVPASGAHEPRKFDIRAVGSVIEQLLAVGGIAETIYETTAAGIAATTSGDLFLVKGDGDPDFVMLYKNASGTAVYQNVSLPSSAAIDALATDFAAQVDDVQTDLATRALRYTEGLTGGLEPRGNVIAQRARMDQVGFFYPASNFQRWSVGYRPIQRIPGIRAIALYPADFAAVDHFLLQIIRRPFAAETGLVEPGADAADEVLAFGTYMVDPTALAEPNVPLSQAHLFRFELSTLGIPALETDSIYWFKLYGYDSADDPVSFGIAQGVDAAAALPVYQRGWYYSSVGGASPMPGSQTIAFQLEEEVGVDMTLARRTGILSRAAARGAAVERWPSASVGSNIPESTITTAAGTVVVPAQLVTYSVPATQTVTDEVIALDYGSGVNLSFQFVTAVTVRRQSDNVLLAEGTAYAINYETGAITGLINTAEYNVKVSFTGALQRYDDIYADPISGVVGLAAGTARKSDPQDFMPTLPAGKVRLFRSLVTANRGVDLIDMRRHDDLVPVGKEAEFALWQMQAHRLLPKLAKRMRAGSPITIAVYGLSISEQGAADPSYYNVPNGPGRDVMDYFYAGRTPADRQTAIPKFDHSDGLGAVHQHEGMVWRLVEAIQARSASAVTVLNLSIGGTTSFDGVTGDKPNGSHPDHLAALIATNAHLVISDFGMNELGNAFTGDYVRGIIDVAQGMGAEFVQIGVPIFAQGSGFARLAEWRETNRQLQQAAAEKGAVFVPLHLIDDPDAIGGLGISWRSASQVNAINHPGSYELRRYGSMLARVVP